MKFGNIVGAFIIVILGVIFYKIALAIIGLIFIFILCISISSYLSERRKKQFRKNYEGKYFLWYSSRKEFRSIIESDLKPLLHIEYLVIYTNKTNIESVLTAEQLKYLRSESATLKFPVLIKIEKDKMHSQSFYQEISQYKYEKINEIEFKQKVINKLNKIA